MHDVINGIIDKDSFLEVHKDFAENIADKVQKKYLLKFGVRKDNPFDPPFVVGVE